MVIIPIDTPRHVCPLDHRHAEALTCYHHHECRCAPCVEGAIRYQARVRRLTAYGRWSPFVPATRARNHIRVLSAAGVGHRRVAALVGMSATHVADIGAGVTMRVSPDVESRILAVPVDVSAFAAGQLVPSTGVVRRLQALMRMGWWVAAIAGELGLERTNVSRLLRSSRITVRTHELVAELYERLWDVPPPQADGWQRRAAAVSRRRAEAAGWVPPLAWDDIDTDPEPPVPDDPDGIDVIAVRLAVEGGRVALTREERHEAVRQLHARGYLDAKIAQFLCVTERTITRDREELRLPSNVCRDAAQAGAA